MQPLLTPMVDVAFQMLLFFLLTTCFRASEGQIPGTLPQAGVRGGGLDQAIVKPIHITLRPSESGVIYELSGSAVGLTDAEELYRQLISRQQAIGSDEVPVIIQPRWDVPWRYVVEADNQAHRARFKTIGITLTG
jgi:biopolymer transport protein ExbD